MFHPLWIILVNLSTLGILVPCVLANSILPTAAAEVAMSSSMWSCSSPGEARDRGRVEKVEVELRVGATYGLPLVKAIPSMFCSSA